MSGAWAVGGEYIDKVTGSDIITGAATCRTFLLPAQRTVVWPQGCALWSTCSEKGCSLFWGVTGHQQGEPLSSVAAIPGAYC